MLSCVVIIWWGTGFIVVYACVLRRRFLGLDLIRFVAEVQEPMWTIWSIGSVLGWGGIDCSVSDVVVALFALSCFSARLDGSLLVVVLDAALLLVFCKSDVAFAVSEMGLAGVSVCIMGMLIGAIAAAVSNSNGWAFSLGSVGSLLGLSFLFSP
jgi:hypothetical protein